MSPKQPKHRYAGQPKRQEIAVSQRLQPEMIDYGATKPLRVIEEVEDLGGYLHSMSPLTSFRNNQRNRGGLRTAIGVAAKSAGYTQSELAEEIGVSQRMITCLKNEM